MTEEPIEFQKRIARLQIWSSTVVTLAGVMLGIGSTMLFTAQSLIGQFGNSEEEHPYALSLVTYYNQQAPLFLLLGLFSIIFAFIVPMIFLNPKSKKQKFQKINVIVVLYLDVLYMIPNYLYEQYHTSK